MAKGARQSSSVEKPVPLKKGRHTLYLVGATMHNAKQDRTNEKSGTTTQVDTTKLNLIFWKAGEFQKDEKGNLIEFEGEPRLYTVGYNFLTYTTGGFRSAGKAKLFPVLRDLGLSEFVTKDAKGVEQLDPGEMEVDFGINGLGGDYAGSELEDLPFYVIPSMGGKEAFNQVVVPVTMMEYKGKSLYGRPIIAQLSIDDKGFNRVESTMEFDEENDGKPLTTKDLMAKGLPSFPFFGGAGYKGSGGGNTTSSTVSESETEDKVEIKGKFYSRDQVKASFVKLANETALNSTRYDEFLFKSGINNKFSKATAAQLKEAGSVLKGLGSNPDWTEFFSDGEDDDSEEAPF